MNRPSEEEMDKIMKLLENGLNGIMGDFASVKSVKVPKEGFTGKMFETFMRYPIIKLNISREGVETNVSLCCMDDIIEVLPDAIGALLGMAPEKYRNDILAKAIQKKMSPNGLYDDTKDDEEEDNEDDE